ncbi:MAG: tetratricopeptide repeat protein [Candidatus Obscuribacterales bacterium]|nr:tetratricopeptide repeat protein [Candidatus Obscuribacterales bacterium]
MKLPKLFFLSLSLFALNNPAFSLSEEGLAHTPKTELREAAAEARASFKAGHYEQSEKQWRQTLTLAEQADLLSVIDCLCGLALVKDKQGDFDESDRLYELAMRNLESHTHNQDNYLYADYLPGLADLYLNHGKIDQAQLIHQKLLDIRINKEPSLDSAQNKENEIMKAETAYANFLRKINRPDLATEHENKAASIHYRLQHNSN